ncbi:MAG TPA: amino acid permease [Chitinophagaceae bacterium]|nr:amino acid permease [Chitinophagaceae bacterium]
MKNISKISLLTASSIVVANMIGTGVFTSLGFQLSSVQNTISIIILWVGGGLIAICGAFAYAELGSHFKETGGDYVFLSKVFHPAFGYFSAWAGLTIGFSAPVALAAIAFTKYLSPFGLTQHAWVAAVLILLVTLLHSFTIKHSSRMQNVSTLVKILFLATLIVIGLLGSTNTTNAFSFSGSWTSEITTTGFAVSMIFVTYSYTGWNAAAYIVDEIKDPLKNLPRALINSTLLIIVLYTLFQLVLLKHASVADMAGKEEVSFISFQNLLGKEGGRWVSLFIAVQLIATISSYLWVGPRVTWAMARNHHLWKSLAKVNAHNIPVRAVWLHALISIVLTLTGSFEQILLYAGFVLQLMSALTVATSLFIKTRPGEFKTPWKPLPQLIFLAFSLWVLAFTIMDKPKESLLGIAMVLAGTIFYGTTRNLKTNEIN